jgi:hypothetical protein
VLGNTKADKFTVLNVFGLLGVDFAPLKIIVGVLILLSGLPRGAVLAGLGVEGNG